MFEFTPAISMMVDCADQDEIDHFFDGLSEGQADRQLNCGWVKDKFGVSWQVVPRYMREVSCCPTESYVMNCGLFKLDANTIAAYRRW